MRILQREPSRSSSVKKDDTDSGLRPDEQTVAAVVEAFQKCLAAYELFRYVQGLDILAMMHGPNNESCYGV